MKRKLESELETVKKRRMYKAKRAREIYSINTGGASDDEEEVSRPLKKMIKSLNKEIVTLRPFIRKDRSNVPSYIN